MAVERTSGNRGRPTHWRECRRSGAGWWSGGLLWLFLLSSVLQGVLSAVGIPEPWRSVVFAAALATVFVPLIRGAAAETRALRAEAAGHEGPQGQGGHG